LQDILSSLPIFHPNRFTWLCILAKAQMDRHETSLDERDLDKSILQITQVIFQPFQLVTKDGPNLITAFFFLTCAFLRRTLKSRRPGAGSIKYCLEYCYCLRDLSLEAFGIARDKVTALLVCALSLQTRLESADVMTSLKQMTDLCREFLTSDDLAGLPALAINALASVVVLLVHDTRPSEQLIECLREANLRLPDLHDVPYALSLCLSKRYNTTRSKDDYGEAIAILDKIITSDSSAGDPNLRSRAQRAAGLTATLAHCRFLFFGRPDYLEEAIFRCRAHLSILPPEDLDRHTFIQQLADLQRDPFDEFGVKDTDSEVLSHDPRVIDLPSFSDLVGSLVNSNAVHLTVEERNQYGDALFSMKYITDAAVSEEAIKYAQLLLKSFPLVDQLAHLTASSLGDLRHRVFERTDDVEHLNASITSYRDLLSMPGAQWMHFRSIRQLVVALLSRF
jgi:tetratricopeptide (TPR) repeat protein